MRLIHGTGAEEPDGLRVVCANCLDDFDDRGGIVFDQGVGKAGLCPECANEVVALVHKEPNGDTEAP